MKTILHSTFSCGSFQPCVLMGRFWCSVIMLSREGLILIKSEVAAVIQSLTQLELFVPGKEWSLCGSGVAGSRDGVSWLPEELLLFSWLWLLLPMTWDGSCSLPRFYLVFQCTGEGAGLGHSESVCLQRMASSLSCGHHNHGVVDVGKDLQD